MKRIFIIILSILFLHQYLLSKELKNISLSNFNKIVNKYGVKAKKRTIKWDDVVESVRNKKILHKLKAVNDFFNNFKYITDIRLWKKKDYWASPYEFLGKGAGDCEDYAIAKYFALRTLGIPDEKLKITYVKLKQKSKKYDESHMVLNYYHKKNSTPIILDNVIKSLKLATKRKDLKPIYSFNASGLWKAQNKTKDLKRKGDNNLKQWQQMMSKI